MMERNGIYGDLVGKGIRCLIAAKETDLMRIIGILLWMKVGPLAFLVANCFNSSKIFEKHINKCVLCMLFMDIVQVNMWNFES